MNITKRRASKMTPDPNHLWLRVSQDKQGDYYPRSTHKDGQCVSGTKSGTLSNVLMVSWVITFLQSTDAWRKSMDGFNTTVKHSGEYQPIWGHCTGRLPTYIWLNTIRGVLEHQNMVFPITKSKNYNYWTFWKRTFPCTLNKEVLLKTGKYPSTKFR